MRKTTYTCDRCKKTSEDNSFLYRIFAEVARESQMIMVSKTPKAEWCRACVVEVGIFGWASTEKIVVENTPEPLSLEELIREVIRDVREEIGRK